MPDEEPNPYQSPEAETRPTRAEVEAARRRLVQYAWFVILCVGGGLAVGLLGSLPYASRGFQGYLGYLLGYGIPYGFVIGLAAGIVFGAVDYLRSYFDARRKMPRDRESTKE